MQSNLSIIPKRYLVGGLFLLLVLGLIIGAIHPYKHELGSQPVALPDVQVLQVQQEDVPIHGEWIGTLDGLVNADVRAQVTGYLLKQAYQEGKFVKQGQLLFQIDPRPFQAALDQTQGQLAQAKAMLANAQAVQRRSELDVERYTPLVKEQGPASKISTTLCKIISPPWQRSKRPKRKSRPSSFRFTYSFTVKDIPAGAKRSAASGFQCLRPTSIRLCAF
jgi:multidrug efflux pump subunit AcrA (membrane-fusion protein)